MQKNAMLKDLIYTSRSIRRFAQEPPVSLGQLRELVDLARMSPSAGNKQALRFALITDPALRGQVFGTLGWAAYLTHWAGPAEGERPTGYIAIVEEGTVHPLDAGIAAQSMMLGAVEMGLGGCMIASVKRNELAGILGLTEGQKIPLVLALGHPVERVECVPMQPGGDVKYYREGGVHYVPKRALEELIILER